MRVSRKTVIFALLITVLVITVAIFLLPINKPNPQKDSFSQTGKVDFNLHIRPILSDKCFKCHGPDANKREAGLRLDIADSAYAVLKENPGAHAIVPGDPLKSHVFLRIISKDTSERMPPISSNLALNDSEIKLIEKWIKQGAVYKPHWAYIPPQPVSPPPVKNKWVKNEIDQFIWARLNSLGLQPSEEADKARLLKRISFDLVGLPPTIEMQEKFLNDNSPDAFEKIVDALMADKHYGEKMAINWLDLARYADSHGYQDDGLRTMWPWRDWVIHAFNQNYSFDKFVRWQLAGDLLPEPTKEMLLATGFNRNHKITQEGGVIDEEYRIEYVTDRTNTFGKAFMGLTMECAHCHDHKYDPISQKEYYRTFAFFNQVNEKGLVGDIQLASPGDPPNMQISSDEVRNVLHFINKKDTAPVTVMIMKDSSALRPTYLLNRGVYDQPGEPVSFGVPQMIFPFDSSRYAKNRLGLTEWLLEKNHPLTARVFVNRIWQEFFGTGLVKTSGDFGLQGEMPSHPELLDWLALDFSNNGMDMKRLVKQIVMSATYRQSAKVSKEKLAADPENRYLSRAPRLRLAAELIRDHVLASSGLLVKEIGGPSVKPYQPKGLWEASTSGRGELSRYIQDHGESLYRRGMYMFIKRTVPPPGMLIFDATNRDQCEVKRLRTNTPLQALVMMNEPLVLESSRVLAERLMLEKTDYKQKLEKAIQLILCRKANKKEQKIIETYFEQDREKFSDSPDKAKQFIQAGEYRHEEIKDTVAVAALMQVINMLYNMEETVMK